MNSEESLRKEASSSKQLRDTTSDIPMVSLPDAVALVRTIHDKGLENAPMLDVAKGCGYTNATSTPFYRKMTAARLFGLVNTSGAGLTGRALDYFKPHVEHGDKIALLSAIRGIKLYSDTLDSYERKKPNVQLISNSFQRSLSITDGCAGVCAQAFVESVRFAGLIDEHGAISLVGASSVKQIAQPPIATKIESEAPTREDCIPVDSQRYPLILDAKTKRTVVVYAPPITKTELERIKNWLEWQLVVEDR